MVNFRDLWESQTARKRVLEAVVFLAATLLIVYLARVQIHLKEATSAATMGNRILIFGITNLIILLLILLVYLVCRTVARILLTRRRGGGARLKSKLVLAFVGLSFIPSILLFIISAEFINRSITTWFDFQVEKSLHRSLEVAQDTYRSSADNALHFGRLIGEDIGAKDLFAPEGRSRLDGIIRERRQEYVLSRVEILAARGESLAQARDPKLPPVDFPRPLREDLNKVLAGTEVTRFTTAGAADLIRVLVPVRANGAVIGAVLADYYVPQSLSGKIGEIARSYLEYRQASTLKNPLRTGYVLTLLLITLVIMFLSVWLGIYLANSLTTPIKELADATQKVAEGDLDVHLGRQGDDEIGMLVASFNRMTSDLRTHQQALRQTNEELRNSNAELEQRRRSMEVVLENVTAGVVSLTREGIFTTVNRSAAHLFGVEAGKVIGKHVGEVFEGENLETVAGLLNDLAMTRQDTLRRQVTVPFSRSKVTLQVSLSAIRDEEGEFVGTVAVFDDLTQVMKAQRMAAWREVARRIAHEIKNPLTPIRLSAQRLRRRYLSRFGDDSAVFDQCTETIIRSVDEMKTLVDEFSSFARMPAGHPTPNDLNSVIQEALSLYQEAHRGVTFSFHPDPSLPLIQLDRDQIKRVMINLLDNAVAAMNGKGRVEIVTSHNPELKMVTCEVADTGHGIAEEDRARLFEPYFSTKKSGTGLGLAIVNTIISDHHGFIRVRDNFPQGTRFVIELPAG